MFTCDDFCLDIPLTHTEYICVSHEYSSLKNYQYCRATKTKKSFFCSPRELVANGAMVGDRADIGRSYFEPEYITEILSFETHEVTLILYPKASFEHSIINRIEESISALG